MERAASRTVPATMGFVNSTQENASAMLAGLGTAVMLVRAVPSADALLEHSLLQSAISVSTT